MFCKSVRLLDVRGKDLWIGNKKNLKILKGNLKSINRMIYKTKDRATQTPLEMEGELRYSGMACGSCYTCDTRRVIFTVKRQERHLIWKLCWTPLFDSPLFFTCTCCQVTWFHVISSMLWWTPRFQRKNNVRFILSPIYFVGSLCFISMLFIFTYAYWCPTQFPYQMTFLSFNSKYNTTGVACVTGTTCHPFVGYLESIYPPISIDLLAW
jgi:hypothetical protein